MAADSDVVRSGDTGTTAILERMAGVLYLLLVDADEERGHTPELLRAADDVLAEWNAVRSMTNKIGCPDSLGHCWHPAPGGPECCRCPNKGGTDDERTRTRPVL